MGSQLNIVSNISDVIITPLKIISVPGGDVLHAMKCSDIGFTQFGEAYFSCVNYSAIKAWKKHKVMTLNLVVPVGKIRFVMYDDRETSQSHGLFHEVILSRSNYFRLTVPPGIWMGFQGLDENQSILLNIANIEHQPDESIRKEINEIQYNWELK